MTSTILLTGGTGTLGRLVSPLLQDAGRKVRVLSRRAHGPGSGADLVTGDLVTGDGLDAALDGVDVVVHCAGDATNNEQTTRHLVRAASAAGVEHLVHISVVGVDRIPIVSRVDRAMFGYFASKLAAEQVVTTSGVPWTILRATQFHDFVLTMAEQFAKLPVVPSFAGVSFRPVDARDVAERLVELALGEPAGLVPDLGGPRVYEMKALVGDYLRAVRKRRPIVSVPTPGKAARAYRAGGNLTLDGAMAGRRTWEAFLTERLG